MSREMTSFDNSLFSPTADVTSITKVMRKVVRKPTPSLDLNLSFASFSTGSSFFLSRLATTRSTIRYVTGSVTASPIRAEIKLRSISSRVIAKGCAIDARIVDRNSSIACLFCRKHPSDHRAIEVDRWRRPSFLDRVEGHGSGLGRVSVSCLSIRLPRRVDGFRQG